MSRLEMGILYIILNFGLILVYSVQFILRMKSNKDELRNLHFPPIPPPSNGVKKGEKKENE